MPDQSTKKGTRRATRRGKADSSQAGEFVREEMHHIREGKHGARSPEQAIAIGLSKARRAGVRLPPPKRGRTSDRTRHSAELAYETGQRQRSPRSPSRRRSRAISKVMKHESTRTASHAALSRHARSAAHARTAAERSAS